MEIEELKRLWAESNRKLEASTRLNTALLRQSNLRTADTSLKRLSRGIAFELVVNVAGIVLLGAFIASHLHQPRFVVPAVALDLYGIALVIAAVRQLAELGAMDYDEPVVAIARRLEQLRLERVRTTFWTLLLAPLMWLPLLIVGMQALFGVDCYAAGLPWLAANVIFGLAVIVAAIFISKRYGPRLGASTPMRAVADAFAGRSLKAALESLDSIRRFEEG
ncbi:MAG TPA: hypothetical protein VFF63_08495 [Candidatus Babeliales bacterium]|nr:hypothetical protein [Candidatus Babeliales bacterium]